MNAIEYLKTQESLIYNHKNRIKNGIQVHLMNGY